MEIYANLLVPEGFLLLSGFYTEDIEDLVRLARTFGFELKKQGSPRTIGQLLSFKKNLI
jgi:ribosomal protein L11 methyltransferase